MANSARPIVFIGGGSLAIEAAAYLLALDAADRLACIVDHRGGRAEDFATLLGRPVPVVPDAGGLADIAGHDLLICFGDPHLRWRTWRELQPLGPRFTTIVHPAAVICRTAEIGAGSIVGPFVFVGPFVTVGANAVLNVRATVGHDAVVGHSAVLSPHCDMNGHSAIGEAAFLGAGAILSPSAKLGHFAKLSAGSVLNKVAQDGDLMHGNPANGRKMFPVPADFQAD